MAVVRPKFFRPLTITAGNHGMVLAAGGPDLPVNIATGTYFSAESFRAAVEAAAASVIPGMKVYITVEDRASSTDRSGRFQFLSSSAFTLKCGAVGFTSYLQLGFFALTYNSAPGSLYSQAAGTATVNGGDFVVTAPHQHQNGWYPEVPPRRDRLPVRDRGMNVHSRTVAGQTKTLIETEVEGREWEWAFLAPHKVYKSFESGSPSRTNEAWERFWESGYDRFRFFPNELSESGFIDYALTQEAMREFAPERQFPKKGLYTMNIEAWKYVA